MTPRQLKKGFRLGGRRVLPMENSIIFGGARHHLRPRTMDVLLELAARPFEVISRAELMKTAWGETSGENTAFTRCIHDLRRCLGDDPRNPEIIRTVPKRGYLLSVEPSPLTHRDRGEHSHWGAYTAIGVLVLAALGTLLWFTGYRSLTIDTPEVSTVSIAVLPFADAGRDDSADWFAEGFSEELMRQLGDFTGLRVAARLSSFRMGSGRHDYRVVGETLDVEYLLTGSAVRADGRLRVDAQLINARTGYQVWARDFEDDESALFDIQQSIIASTMGSLQPDVAGDFERNEYASRDLAAYDAYLQGRYYLHRQTEASLSQALELFETAVSIDDTFALAWASLANARALLVSHAGHPRPGSRRTAAIAVERALELAPDLAEAHAALGLHRIRFGNPEEAEEPLRRAVELNPNCAMAHVWLAGLQVTRGHFRQARRWNRRAWELDPLNPAVNQSLYLLAAWMGDRAEAARFRERLRSLDPDNPSHLRLFASVAIDFGDYAEGVDWANRALAVGPDDFRTLALLGRAYTLLGRFERARPILEQARELAPADTSVMRATALYYLASDRMEQLTDYATRLLGAHPADRPERNSPAETARILGGIVNFSMGNYQRAREHLERGLNSQVPNIDYPSYAPLLATSYRRLGLEDRAARVVAEADAVAHNLRNQGLALPALTVAQAAISVADQQPTRAISLLIEAAQSGWKGYWLLVNDPRFAALAEDPGFQQLLLSLREQVDEQSATVLTGT